MSMVRPALVAGGEQVNRRRFKSWARPSAIQKKPGGVPKYKKNRLPIHLRTRQDSIMPVSDMWIRA